MRISNISDYLGTSKNVVATEYVNKAQLRSVLTITDDQTGDPLDLTGFTIRLSASFATAASIEYAQGRAGQTGTSITVGQITADTALADKDLASAVTITDAANGVVTIEWPENLYEGTVPIDARTDIPVVLAFLFADNAAGMTKTIVRFVRFVRYGVSA